MSTTGSIIRSLRKQEGLTTEELGRKLKVTRNAISNYEANRRIPDMSILVKMSEIFDVSLEFLLGKTESTKQANYVKIPVVGLVKAGLPSEAIEDVIDWEEIPKDWLKGGREYFALEISGDSMSPRMEEGDVIIVQKQQWCNSGDIVVVRVNGEDATVKKVVKQDNGILLVAYNSSYPPIFYSNEQMRSLPVEYLGKVVELRGKF